MEESVTLSSLIPPIVLVTIIVMLVKRSRDKSSDNAAFDNESFTIESSPSGQLTEELSVEEEYPDEIPVSGSQPDQYKVSKGDGMNFGEMFRDKTRDNMAQLFSLFGAKAELSDRGRPEESIGLSLGWMPGRNSLGIIDIDGGLIPFINVIRTKRRDRYGPPRYKHVLCVPDDTIPLDHKALSIKTIRSKSFPIFGKVLGVAWKGASNVEPLVKAFSGDDEINEFVSEFGDVKINTHPNKFQGWTIEITKGNITRNHWNALQKIANYLLSSPR